MSEEIRCNTSTLTSDNGDVDQYIKDIRDCKARIENILNSLKVAWEGEASEAFMVRMAGEMAKLEEYCLSLDSLSGYEKTAVSEYEACVRDVSGIIDAITV